MVLQRPQIGSSIRSLIRQIDHVDPSYLEASKGIVSISYASFGPWEKVGGGDDSSGRGYFEWCWACISWWIQNPEGQNIMSSAVSMNHKFINRNGCWPFLSDFSMFWGPPMNKWALDLPRLKIPPVRPSTFAIGDPHTKCQYVKYMSFIQQVKGRWSQITCQDSPCLSFFLLSSLSLYINIKVKGQHSFIPMCIGADQAEICWEVPLLVTAAKIYLMAHDGSWWLMIWVWYLNMLGNLKNPIGKLWLFDS